MTRYENRYVRSSALVHGTSHTDPQTARIKESVILGSRDLCRAIFETGTLYRQMGKEELENALIYAYGSKQRLIG